MKVEQIFTLVNNATKEALGKEAVLNEDLSNVVDMGTEIFNANAVDNYVKSLVNHIGKVIFVNRPYSGKVPSVLMDAWEFGSVLEKVSSDIPEASENKEWDLQDKGEYKQDIFYKPAVTAKFFNSRVTFEVPVSITEKQVKESFSNAEQLNGFISMIYSSVEKSMTLKVDSLVMRTINNMIARTLDADKATFAGGDYSKGSTSRCVNLLKLFKEQHTDSKLTKDNAIYDPDFIRFASYIMSMYKDRLGSISTMFNVGGKARFTPDDMLHFVLLSDFAKSADTYLYSDVRHNEFVMLPNHETIPYFQGSGEDYKFASTSAIDVTFGNEKDTKAPTKVTLSGIVGVMFDRDALGVSNLERRVTSNYNAKAEFFNNYYKFEAGYFNDTNENFVVFFIA